MYHFLDCGDRRRLENFGGVICDRPAPTATGSRRAPELWRQATLIYDGEKWRGAPPPVWQFADATTPTRLQLYLGAKGQVGFFPEQIANWRWLEKIVAPHAGMKMLNLFAHTGGATLVGAAAGAAVCHVDAAGAAVKQARRNAALSGLADAPIRWLVDDAGQFLRREIKRGNFYDGIILDPPAFGRCGKTQWKLSRDLPELLRLVARALSPTAKFVLFTCHAPDWSDDLAAYFPAAKIATTPLTAGGQLPLGQARRLTFDDN
ncbi:methyltransferase [Planctomycetales bacterium]|nr:methyltransferase [Planctomycetales bacterium]GHT04823.1 methyltransferase [Planctomycetales bacterium]